MPAPIKPNTEPMRTASVLSFQKRRFDRYLHEMRSAGYVVIVTAPNHIPQRFRAE